MDMKRVMLGAALFLALAPLAGMADPSPASVLVAAADAPDAVKARAAFVCDGAGDQEEITAAVQGLPPAGGMVMLSGGTYDIRRVEGTLGGVIISRSDVVLCGEGAATLLRLAAGQDTNVIRIIGDGVGNVTIRDLCVDANRDGNAGGAGDPNVSHGRFEFCGIKAFCGKPGDSCGAPCHDITVERTEVREAHRLGIMLEGPNMRVVGNRLGNAGSDVVEILTGPGEIRGNQVEITGRTHVAIGSDRADNILMTDNIVRVRAGGDLDIGFRSWAGSRRHVISGNILTVDEKGRCGIAVDARGSDTVISGNCLHAPGDAAMRLRVGAGDTVVSANVLEGILVEVTDAEGAGRPVMVRDNLFKNSRLGEMSNNALFENNPGLEKE